MDVVVQRMTVVVWPSQRYNARTEHVKLSLTRQTPRVCVGGGGRLFLGGVLTKNALKDPFGHYCHHDGSVLAKKEGGGEERKHGAVCQE